MISPLCYLIRRLQAEEANLPETMCRLSVGMRSVEELRALLRTAKDLMLNTPKSFRKILRSALYANLSQVLHYRCTTPHCTGCRVCFAFMAGGRVDSGGWVGGSLGGRRLTAATVLRIVARRDGLPFVLLHYCTCT